MRPNVIELRQGSTHWLVRADYTNERWKMTDVHVSIPYSVLRVLVMQANPQYLVEWPELQGLTWEDC